MATEHESPEKSDGNENGTKSSSTASKSRRRPVSLLRDRGLRFVNRMRNVGWLAGYCHPGDSESFLLQQTNNIEQGLRIEVGPKHASLTRAVGRPVMVMVHARGYRDEYGPQLALHCIEINKPSLLDLPMDEVWASGFGQGKEASKILSRLAKESFSPFDDAGEIKPEYKEFIAHSDSESGEYELNERAEQFMKAHQMLGDVLEASGGVIDSRLGRGQNYISIAGFVDAKAWVPATEHRKAYALIMVRQHDDQENNIPVRVVGKMANALYKRASEGDPVLVEGSARRKVIPNDDGEIVSRHCYIETTKIGPAQVDHDILMPLPEWWMTIRDRLVSRVKARKAERAEKEAQKKEQEAATAADLSDIAETL